MSVQTGNNGSPLAPEWLAVPAIFPATQFYYVAMAVPAIAGRPVVAALLALPMVLMAPLVVLALAVLEVRAAPSLRAAFVGDGPRAIIRPAGAAPRSAGESPR